MKRGRKGWWVGGWVMCVCVCACSNPPPPPSLPAPPSLFTTTPHLPHIHSIHDGGKPPLSLLAPFGLHAPQEKRRKQRLAQVVWEELALADASAAVVRATLLLGSGGGQQWGGAAGEGGGGVVCLFGWRLLRFFFLPPCMYVYAPPINHGIPANTQFHRTRAAAASTAAAAAAAPAPSPSAASMPMS